MLTKNSKAKVYVEDTGIAKKNLISSYNEQEKEAILSIEEKDINGGNINIIQEELIDTQKTGEVDKKTKISLEKSKKEEKITYERPDDIEKQRNKADFATKPLDIAINRNHDLDKQKQKKRLESEKKRKQDKDEDEEEKAERDNLAEAYASDIALILDKHYKNNIFNDPKDILNFIIILLLIKIYDKDSQFIVSKHEGEIILKNLNNQLQESILKQFHIFAQSILKHSNYEFNKETMDCIFGYLNEDISNLHVDPVQYTPLNLAKFLTIYLSIDQLRRLRKMIFELEHPRMPACIRNICLYIRLKTNGASLYFYKKPKKVLVPSLVGLISSLLELYNLVNDVILLSVIYEYSLRYANQYNDYIFLFTTKLICICIPYIITYTSGNQALIAKKIFYPETFSKKSWYIKSMICLYLTFLGPLYFIFLKIFALFIAILKTLILILPIKIYNSYNEKIERLIFKIGLGKSDYEGFLQQLSICQLIFQNLPLAILNILLIANVFIAPGILSASADVVYRALSITLVNIIIQFIQLKVEAKFFQEDFFNYAFNIMKAKLKWIPFLHKIEKHELLDMTLDYGYIRCPMWIFSSWFGYYKEISFQFNEESMIIFVEVINNLQTFKPETSEFYKAQKILIRNSVDKLDISYLGTLLGVLTRKTFDEVPLDSKNLENCMKIIITDFDEINWMPKLKILHSLCSTTNALHSGGKIDLKTYYGNSILHLIIESETDYNSQHYFWFKKLLNNLIECESFINFGIKDFNNKTAFELAIDLKKNHLVIKLFEAIGNNFRTEEGDNVFHLLLNASWPFYVEKTSSFGHMAHLLNEKNNKDQTPLASFLVNKRFYYDTLKNFEIDIPLNDVQIARLLLKNYLDNPNDNGNKAGDIILSLINQKRTDKIQNIEELKKLLSNTIKNEIKDENQLSKFIDTKKKADEVNYQEIFPKDANSASKSPSKNLIYSILSFCLEALALIDLITDFIVIVQLASNGYTFWTSLSVLTLLAPYYTCYSALVACFIERNSFSQGRGILGWILISPLNILFFILLDLFYMLLELLSAIPNLFITIITLGKINNAIVLDNKINIVFEKVFKLDIMDVQGIRQLRTISQLIFESFPQILLQIQLLAYGGNLNVSISSLIISLATAILHTLLETTLLIIDSRACKASFWYYSSLCLTSRLNWVPFIEKLNEMSQKPEVNIPLDYQNMKYRFCYFDHKIEYKFSRITFEILKREISKLPKKENQKSWLDISLFAFKDANLEEILDFLFFMDRRAVIKGLTYTKNFESEILIGKDDHLKMDFTNKKQKMNDFIAASIGFIIISKSNTLKEIALNFGNSERISDKGLIALLSCIKAAKMVEIFRFRPPNNKNPTDKFMFSLAEIINHMQYLKEFELDISECNKISEEGISILTNALSMKTLLIKLDLRFFNLDLINEKVIQYISNMLQMLKSILELSLDFSQCRYVDDQELKYLAQGLDYLTNIQKLKLDISAYDVELHLKENGLLDLATSIKKLTKITKLEMTISGHQAIPEKLNNLVKDIKNLQSINYLDLNFDSTECNDEVIKSLTDNIAYLQSITTLKLIFLYCRKISAQGLTYLKNMLINNHSIKSLSFDFSGANNCITDNGLNNLFGDIQNMPPIQTLKLSFILCELLTDEGLQYVSKMLSKLSLLSELDITLESSRKITDNAIIVLANNIKNCTCITKLILNLNNNRNLTNASLTNLAEAIQYLTSLEQLNLELKECRDLNSKGSLSLFNAIKNHPSLISLKLILPANAELDKNYNEEINKILLKRKVIKNKKSNKDKQQAYEESISQMNNISISLIPYKKDKH